MMMMSVFGLTSKEAMSAKAMNHLNL